MNANISLPIGTHFSFIARNLRMLFHLFCLFMLTFLVGWAVKRGKVVVIEGKPGCGKSLLAKKIAGNSIICFADEAMRASPFTKFSISKSQIPDGIFSVDEPQLIEEKSMAWLINKMKRSNRGFIITTQSFDFVQHHFNDGSIKCVRIKLN